MYPRRRFNLSCVQLLMPRCEIQVASVFSATHADLCNPVVAPSSQLAIGCALIEEFYLRIIRSRGSNNNVKSAEPAASLHRAAFIRTQKAERSPSCIPIHPDRKEAQRHAPASIPAALVSPGFQTDVPCVRPLPAANPYVHAPRTELRDTARNWP
jgi:hypothetical protein